METVCTHACGTRSTTPPSDIRFPPYFTPISIKNPGWLKGDPEPNSDASEMERQPGFIQPIHSSIKRRMKDLKTRKTPREQRMEPFAGGQRGRLRSLKTQRRKTLIIFFLIQILIYIEEKRIQNLIFSISLINYTVYFG